MIDIHNREFAKRNQKHEYLLNKRVYCGVCNCKMSATPNHSGKKIYLYHRCMAKNAYARDCTNTVTYSAQSLDAQVWEWVKSMLSDPDRLRAGFEEPKVKQEQKNSPIRERLDVLESLIEDNKVQLEKLIDLYLSNEFSKEIVLDRKLCLEKTLTELEE